MLKGKSREDSLKLAPGSCTKSIKTNFLWQIIVMK